MHYSVLSLCVICLLGCNVTTGSNPQPAPAPVTKPPRVLLIGDSISMGYDPEVRRLLGDVAEVHRIKGNAESSRRSAGEIDRWLGNEQWDVVHINVGLWDVVGGKTAEGCAVPLDEYRRNVETILLASQLHGAKVVWASTTPVPPTEGRQRRESDVVQYNAAAAEVAAGLGIAVNDLHDVASKHLPQYQFPNNVHMTATGSAALGAATAHAIAAALGIPLPKAGAGPGSSPINVLCLGDSNGEQWIPALQQRLSAKLIPAALSGMTVGFDNPDATRNMLKALPDYLDGLVLGPQVPVDYVLILLGTNDAKAIFADRQGEVGPNFRKLITILRGVAWPGNRTPQIILISPPPYGAAGDDNAAGKYAGGKRRVVAMLPELRQLGDELNCLVIDIQTPLADQMPTISPDGVHFNAAGYEAIVDLIAKRLDRRLLKHDCQPSDP